MRGWTLCLARIQGAVSGGAWQQLGGIAARRKRRRRHPKQSAPPVVLNSSPRRKKKTQLRTVSNHNADTGRSKLRLFDSPDAGAMVTQQTALQSMAREIFRALSSGLQGYSSSFPEFPGQPPRPEPYSFPDFPWELSPRSKPSRTSWANSPSRSFRGNLPPESSGASPTKSLGRTGHSGDVSAPAVRPEGV